MLLTNQVMDRLSTWVAITILFTLALLLMGCTSDAELIREANQAAALNNESTDAPSIDVQSTKIPESANMSVFEIRDGDCLQMVVPDSGVELESTKIVGCNGPWDYKAINSFVVEDDANYPSDAFFYEQSISQCDRRYSTSMFPTKESWEQRDRTVTCLQESFGLDTTELKTLDAIVNIFTIMEGECANHLPISGYSMVELVDCQEDWDFRVVNSFSLADGPFPGDVYVESQADSDCGVDANNFYSPTVESWEGFGDRRVVCVYE